MQHSPAVLSRAAFYLSFASAVAVLFSIAAAQTLLALALAALLLSGDRLRFPPVLLPLGLFAIGTVVSMLLSEDPSAGRPQIRKLFVFFMLLVVYSTFRSALQVRWLVLAWGGAGALAGGLALVQYWRKIHQAQHQGEAFYEFYVSERITGFMSHWMTFGGTGMIVLLMLAAFVLFSGRARGRLLALSLVAIGLLGLSLLLGMTRSIWLASAAAGLYLLWCWKRRLALVAPVAIVAAVLLAPPSVRTRATSILRPQREVDSNQHRIVCWRTGWRMIQAHPWFGLGPELVRLRFMEYVPPDVSRPLPTGWYGHLHNFYLHYAAERGIPVLLVLLWFLGKLLRDYARALRVLPPGPGDARFILHGAVSVILAVLISGLFELNLGDSEVLMLFLAAVAGAYVVVDQARREAGVV